MDLVLALPAYFTGGDHEKSKSDIIAEGTEQPNQAELYLFEDDLIF